MDNKKNLLLSIGASAIALIFIVFLVVGLFKAPEKSTDLPKENTPSVNTDTNPPKPSAPALANNIVTLSFIGDCILGSDSGEVNKGNFSWYAENKPHYYFFSQVYEELSKDSLTFANMECVLSDRNLTKTEKDYDPAFWFIAPAVNADILSLGSVEVAGVVNNHTRDYGAEGYEDTIKALEAQGITVGEDCIPLYFEESGLKIGVVYAHLWSDYHLSYVIEALNEMEGKCDYRIVFFHGGEEGVHEPDNYKITCLRKLANEGLCDLIVGSHPHVLQPMEIVNGVPIVYSLGNFCYSGSNYPENRTIIFQVLLTQKEGEIFTSTRIVPCYVYTGDRNNWQPAIVTNPQDKQDIIDFMNTPVDYKAETEPSTESTAATETLASSYEEPEYSEPYEEDYNYETVPTQAETSPYEGYEPGDEFIYG